MRSHLLIVRPHADDFYDAFILYAIFHKWLLVNLIDKAVLDIDAPGEQAAEISNKCLVSGRILKRILPDDLNQSFCLVSEAGRLQIFDIFYSLPVIDNLITHQSTSSSGMQSSIGVSFPFSRDSVIPGIEFR